eukprot:5960690-Prymnesium_polylepis.1
MPPVPVATAAPLWTRWTCSLAAPMRTGTPVRRATTTSATTEGQERITHRVRWAPTALIAAFAGRSCHPPRRAL